MPSTTFVQLPTSVQQSNLVWYMCMCVRCIEPWMQEEVKQYEEGRRKLAQLMEKDPESFSDAQVKVCMYLFAFIG